jgi:hypothetical protein
MAAAQTKPEMNPCVAHFQAFLAPRPTGIHFLDFIQVSAICRCHREFSYNGILSSFLTSSSTQTFCRIQASLEVYITGGEQGTQRAVAATKVGVSG